jgi:hypothetical protein
MEKVEVTEKAEVHLQGMNYLLIWYIASQLFAGV